MTSGAGKGSDNRHHGAQAQRSACLVRQLAEPRLHGLAPGLCEKDGLFEIDRAVWGCCLGSGFREVLPEKTGAPSTMVRCDLASRLRLAQGIHSQYRSLFPETPLSLTVGAKTLAPYLERLSLIVKGASHRGVCQISLPASPIAPQVGSGSAPTISLWQVALTAAWRFGLKCHVVDLSKTESDRLLPPSTKEAPQLIFIDRVDRLWDPAVAERFELVVQYAYNALAPLFISVLPLANAPHSTSPFGKASGSSSVKGAFSARISKAKANLALSALSPDCQPKLRSTTSGVDIWLTGYPGGQAKT